MTKTETIALRDRLFQMIDMISTTDLVRIGFAYPTVVIGVNGADVDMTDVVNSMKSALQNRVTELDTQIAQMPDEVEEL